MEDCRGDKENLLYDEMHMRIVPQHYVLHSALSQRHKIIRINFQGEQLRNNLLVRYFDSSITKKIYTSKLEKRFRQKSPLLKETSKIIPISHVRYATDDEGVIITIF